VPHYKIIVQPAKTDVSVTRIVKAKNEARAVAHVVGDTIVTSLAGPDDFMALAKAGGEIEVAEEAA
jgi:hypothetical protein